MGIALKKSIREKEIRKIEAEKEDRDLKTAIEKSNKETNKKVKTEEEDPDYKKALKESKKRRKGKN